MCLRVLNAHHVDTGNKKKLAAKEFTVSTSWGLTTSKSQNQINI